MDLSTVIVVSSLLLLAAAVMMLSHLRAWRTFQQQLPENGDCPLSPADTEELDYRRRQFRRRMQTSAMLGLLAFALPGIFLTAWLRSGWFFLIYCVAVILGVCWVLLLALVDVWATKHHFGRLRHQCLVEKLKLNAEVRRIQAARGNGDKE
jgi:hypothetical protein